MGAFSKISNRFRMVNAYYRGRMGSDIYPQEVVIELTNHCNLACVMCPQPTAMTRAKGMMEEDLFRSIIDQIASHTELVYLYGTGESLLHKKLVDYTRYAHDKGLTTVVSTNGLPITEKSARSLLDSGLDHLIVALDGGTQDTYERIRLKGDFNRLILNIKTLLRERRESKSSTRITLQMIVMAENVHEKKQFVDLFTPEEKREVFQFRFKPVFDTYADQKGGVKHTKPCFWLWNMMSISWNGRVQLCCMDYDANCLDVSVKEHPIHEIWNSETFWALRAQHKNLDFSGSALCEGCNIPEQGYFSDLTIMVSPFFSADMVRRILPVYERLLLLGKGEGRI